MLREIIRWGAALGCAFVMAACGLTPQQIASVQAETALLAQIGNTSIKIWCGTSGIIYVIEAKETQGNTHAKAVALTNSLKNNADAAATACPSILGTTPTVLTGTVTPANATPSILTPTS